MIYESCDMIARATRVGRKPASFQKRLLKRLEMLAEAHRRAAEDIEDTILPLQSSAKAARVVIESAWGAAFHWIAFGSETKHSRHQESHARLGRFLRSLGEGTTADWWETLDRVRQGGWYGGQIEPEDVQEAFTLLEQIRLWATR
jgi:hypothetical protein